MSATERTRDRRDAGSAAYEVLAVRYGSLTTSKRELFYRYDSYGEPDARVEMAYFFWLLRRDGTDILVDTGFDPSVGARRGRVCICEPVEAMRRLGVDPEAVSTVIVTHFHYDHVGNLDAFPNAEFVVPRKEMEFWSGSIASRFQFSSHVEAAEIGLLQSAAEAGRVRFTEGTEEILDGITAVEVGGHSPGQQVTVVASPGGDVVLASDAVHFYEEFRLQRPFGVIADLGRMYAAYDLLEELVAKPGAVLVPGHDPAVLESFGSPGAEYADLAVQVA